MDFRGKNTGEGCHSLLQGIFPTQGSNWDLLHCKETLSLLSEPLDTCWQNSSCPRPPFGEGSGTPLQYSCLENPMDGGAWLAAVHGIAGSRTRLSDFTFTFHFPALAGVFFTTSATWEAQDRPIVNIDFHSSTPAWKIPWTEEPGRLHTMAFPQRFQSQTCREELSSKVLHFSLSQWHPTPVLLPGKSHGWRSLVGCSPWGC